MRTGFWAKTLISAVALVAIVHPVASQKSNLLTGDPADAILPIAQRFGEAEMDVDDLGYPMIVGTIEGLYYFAYYYGCNDDGTGCNSIQLRATWTVDSISLEHLNEWNRTTRFGKAYVESDGDVALEMEVNLDFGVTPNNLDDTFDWWRIGLIEFAEHLQAR